MFNFINKSLCTIIFIIVIVSLPYKSYSQPPSSLFSLIQANTETYSIPPSEKLLPTFQAKEWFHVTNKKHILEGAAFEENGDLIFCDVSAKQVLRLTPSKKLSIITTFDNLRPGGIAIHKNGRTFIAALNLDNKAGGIFSINPDGTDLKTIINIHKGFMPNDLVFDKDYGFYFTDFKGTSTVPTGGVYYVTPDFKTITPVLSNLSMANGVALSPNGTELWVTEFGRGLLHRISLQNATTPTPIGTTIAYHFTGTAPDSMRIDKQGNLYVVIYNQGRVLIFNQIGIPIGQITLPNREKGQNLLTTSLAVNDDLKNIFIVSSDQIGKNGANIFSLSSNNNEVR